MFKVAELSEKEEKCIRNAREVVQFDKKWGRWSGSFYLIASVAYIILGLLFGMFVLWYIDPMVNPPKQNLQQIDPVKGAMAVGMILGFISGFMLFKGIGFLSLSINYFKGDRASHLLVEYHDAILALAHNQTDQEVNAPDSDNSSPS